MVFMELRVLLGKVLSCQHLLLGRRTDSFGATRTTASVSGMNTSNFVWQIAYRSGAFMKDCWWLTDGKGLQLNLNLLLAMLYWIQHGLPRTKPLQPLCLPQEWLEGTYLISKTCEIYCSIENSILYHGPTVSKTGKCSCLLQ